MDLSVLDVVGAIGVALIIVTYYLLQTGRMESRSPYYSILNAAGSGMILASLWFDFNLAAFVVESFWLSISIYGTIKAVSGRG